MKMKAGKLNKLLKEGFSLYEIYLMQKEIKKLPLEEKKLIQD